MRWTHAKEKARGCSRTIFWIVLKRWNMGLKENKEERPRRERRQRETKEERCSQPPMKVNGGWLRGGPMECTDAHVILTWISGVFILTGNRLFSLWTRTRPACLSRCCDHSREVMLLLLRHKHSSMMKRTFFLSRLVPQVKLAKTYKIDTDVSARLCCEELRVLACSSVEENIAKSIYILAYVLTV